MKKVILIALIMVSAGLVLNAQDAPKEETEKKKSAKEYIADLSADRDEKTIVAAAEWVGKEKNKDAVSGLVNLVTDKRERVRIESVVALGIIAEENSVEVLNKALLEDSNAEVRYASLLATMRIGSKKSIDAYRQSQQSETDPFILDLLKKMEEKLKGAK